jgi:FkbH-like protein
MTTTVHTPPADAAAPAPPAPAPLSQIRSWHAEGTFVEHFPDILGLLHRLDDTARASVGQLIARLDQDEVVARHPDTQRYTVAITGHSTLDGLIGPLTGELARHGLLLAPELSAYDSYLQDLRDPQGPLRQDGTDLVLCVLDPETVSDELPSPWRVEDAEELLGGKLRQLTGLLTGHAAAGGAPVVVNTLPLPARLSRQLVDLRSRARLGVAWHEFNAGLLKLSLEHPGVLTVDLDPLLAAGAPATDPRMNAYARVRFADGLFTAYAKEVGHLVRALTGRTRKCLVLDLDNTLWDGILGDDGPEGIAVAGSFRGEAFGAFQKVVKQLGAQGVVLAACSKNDREPVLDVLRTHPEMQLREEDFATVQANWRPKDENIREIAARLNLGTDSFVFADDSPFECGLVESALPEIAVLRLDEEPALHIERLLADSWFTVREVTEEDRARTSLYRVEAAREEFRSEAGSTEEYLAGLGVTVRFSPPSGHEVIRVAQLSQRTNQFNLTTVRLQPEDVQSWLDDPARLVLAIRSTDRFGDNGLVGAVFAEQREDGLHLDNILLSCRVFGRGIEQICLGALLRAAAERGHTAVHGHYRPTKKNARMLAFYPDHGFAAEGDAFRHGLADLDTTNPMPEHISLDADLSGVPAPH